MNVITDLSALSAYDAEHFADVIREFEAANARQSSDDREKQALLALVLKHGTDAVREAIRSGRKPGRHSLPTTRVAELLGEGDPLLAQVVNLFVENTFQPVGPYLRDQLLALLEEFPDFALWREAMKRTVATGMPSLHRVERVLRHYQQTGEWEPVPQARRATGPARGGKSDESRAKATTRRPEVRRESTYDEAELEAARQRDREAGWDKE